MSEKLLISESKDNNLEGKSNEELLKQALIEGMNRHFDKTLKEAKKLEQIEEMAKALTNYEYKLCERLPKDKCLLTSAIHAQVSCDYCKIAEFLYNADYRRVIMCKDCAYRDTESCSLSYWDGENLVSNVSDCDFCSGAKAKDSEEGRG